MKFGPEYQFLIRVSENCVVINPQRWEVKKIINPPPRVDDLIDLTVPFKRHGLVRRIKDLRSLMMQNTKDLGTVDQLWRYPFKSMNGERIERCVVTPAGVLGDRGWALRDVETGKLGSGKRLPTLLMCSARYLVEPAAGTLPHAEITFPDGSTTQTDHDDAAQRLSAYLGKPVTIESSSGERAGEHFDDLPLSMQTSASISALREMMPGSEIEHRRFRHNFAIQSPEGIDGFAEIGWIGRSIRVGEVSMDVIKPIPRCPMVSAPQQELEGDQSILKTILAEVDRCVGVYATTDAGGMVCVGDRAEMI